jgi:hypothetical protein
MGTETVYVGSSVLGAERRGQICNKFLNGVRLGICYGERPDFVKNTACTNKEDLMLCQT